VTPYVPVAVASRSGTDESVHHGAVVALSPDGSVAWAAGDAQLAIFPRSALKPLQAAAMVGAGLALDDRLLAVVCASHDGRPEHVAAVREVLAGAGLGEDDLDNTPTLPLEVGAAWAVVRAGGGPASITQNCSGKHAGMLATAARNGWPTSGYRDPAHAVQRLILDDVARRAGGVSVDGHPVHRAMTTCPEMVGGPARDVTRLMQLVPGLLAKDGAEGVEVAALPDGRAVALKIADGGGRARTPVVVAALRSLGVDLAADALVESVLGHGEPVGSVRSLVGSP
jgi:L-asparaginase II